MDFVKRWFGKKKVRKEIELLVSLLRHIIEIQELNDLFFDIDMFFLNKSWKELEINVYDFGETETTTLAAYFVDDGTIAVNSTSLSISNWSAMLRNEAAAALIGVILHEYCHKIQNEIKIDSTHELHSISIKKYEGSEAEQLHNDQFKFISNKIDELYINHLDNLGFKYTVRNISFSGGWEQNVLVLYL
ncbi:hypothetical protein LCGC14_0302910 [marine sediment metagenome]|uniref:Uncharacterized protein n=1 Tax=marine sediment metagenome TaxID=412755 RepID=A0A0F9TUL7_9ZZZZ